MISFRGLDAARDAADVLDLMQRASDYMQLEYGRPPDATSVTDFFAACVPGGNLAQAVKLGICRDDRLVGILDMGFGYPAAQDAYIGLVMLDPAVRGQSLGEVCFAHLQRIATVRGADRMLVAVLERNPKGRAFWQRMGFEPEQRFNPPPGDPAGHVRLRMVQAISARSG